MISREQVINRLRAANFTFQRQADRVELWRHRGGVERVAVPRRDHISDDQAKVILVQAGLTPAQIVEFFRAASTT